MKKDELGKNNGKRTGFKDTLFGEVKHLFTKSKNKKSSSEELLDELYDSGRIEKIEQEERDHRSLMEVRKAAVDDDYESMSFEDLMNPDLVIEPEPKAPTPFQVNRVVEDDASAPDESVYLVDLSFVSEALLTAQVRTSPEKAQQERFFSSSCLVSGHNFCHVISCYCPCHISVVFRDKAPDMVIYSGYSVYKTLVEYYRDGEEDEYDTIVNGAYEYLESIFKTYDIKYSHDQLVHAIDVVSNMVTSDSGWTGKDFTNLFK